MIRYEVADGIGTITIDRPEKKGAMTYAMLGEFIGTIHRAARDDAARVLLLTGAPGTFCAGTDLADLQTVPGTERQTRGTAEETDIWWPLVQCPKPVVCAVDGPAVGMGAEFTSQCDVRIASTNARFGWVFVHRGLVPDTGAGTWLLPVLVADAEQAASLAAKVPAVAKRLMARWWPGGLTIVLARAPELDVDLGGDGTTIGVRVPDHDVPRELARRVGPLVTTSANRHGRPTPPDADGVRAELGEGVAVVVDGGVCAGEPSTVVSVVDGGLRIVRQGVIAGADIVRS